MKSFRFGERIIFVEFFAINIKWTMVPTLVCKAFSNKGSSVGWALDHWTSDYLITFLLLGKAFNVNVKNNVNFVLISKNSIIKLGLYYYSFLSHSTNSHDPGESQQGSASMYPVLPPSMISSPFIFGNKSGLGSKWRLISELASHSRTVWYLLTQYISQLV